MIYYHVDRTKLLKPHSTISLTQCPLGMQEMMQTLDELYPEGLSHHGFQYAIESYKGLHTSGTIEQIFELIRLWKYPHIHSRFQSLFAFTNLNDALTFKRTSEQIAQTSNLPVYEIQITQDAQIHISDMNLLFGETIVQAYSNAIRYWEGTLTEQPIQEALIKPPVKVLDRLIL